MRRPQPRPTLFPYTTLFRSVRIRAAVRWARSRRRSAGRPDGLQPSVGWKRAGGHVADPARFHPTEGWRPRSEEHTSELQSRFDLVCRLLLEKKKKTK